MMTGRISKNEIPPSSELVMSDKMVPSRGTIKSTSLKKNNESASYNAVE